MQRGGGVGHGLHHPHVGAQHVLQEVLAVAGEGQPAHVGVARLAHLAEQRRSATGADQCADDQQDRRDRDQAEQGADPVEHLFHDPPGAAQLRVLDV